MMVNRIYGKEYPCVKKIYEGVLSKIGTGERYKIYFISKYWRVIEMTPTSVYDQFVVFEVVKKNVFDWRPVDYNGRKQYGHKYISIGYEQVEKELEFPQGSIAARAIASTTALSLYPEMPNNKKKDAENRKKREEYVEKHWREVHLQIVKNMPAWEARQRYNSCDRKWRIYDNDLFLDKLKNQMMPQTNLFEEFLDQ
jgi:hypothetical protein